MLFGKNFELKQAVLNDKFYPSQLQNIARPPSPLYYYGVLPAADEPAIAIVGTRKATFEGRQTAKKIARDLAEKGIIIVSGLAMGIDAAAHEGALAGNGRTAAVLANGLDEIYPRHHQKLAEDILNQKGAVISEYPPATPAYPSQFLERNRIISGLSLAVIICEAPIPSGALATARWAAEQGKEVLVVPGPSNNVNYRGSHLLIREGARLVTSAEEILEDLKLNDRLLQYPPAVRDGLTETSDDILKILSQAKKPLTIDKILEQTKLEPQTVNQRLTYLIFEGLVEENCGRFKIKKD